jgi:hypothetical protein
MIATSCSEVQAEIVRIPYPVEETVAAIRKSSIPDFYACLLKNAK